MSLKCGIVGLPNVGKSTLFNALSHSKAVAANFPFCTIEPNVAMVTVPDARLDKLEELVVPQKVIPTVVEIMDIAGLVKGASKGEGLGNKFLGNIKNTNAIIHVVRCFEDDNIVHVDGSVNPVRDKEVIDMELQFKDLDSIEKKISKYEKLVKANLAEDMRCLEVLKEIKKHLESGLSIRLYPFEEGEERFVEDLNLITLKPVIYVCNVDEKSVNTGNKYVEALRDAVKNDTTEVILISAGIEAEIAALDSLEDRAAFLEDMGLHEPGIHQLIRACYKILDLITYFTAGVKEVRAWTIIRGTRAPGAAGEIHTDFEKGFIRAEVIHYEDYVKYGSEAAVKEVGKMSVEGKEYVVQDGDIIHFRFNV